MKKAMLPFLAGLGLSCHGCAQLGQLHKGACTSNGIAIRPVKTCPVCMQCSGRCRRLLYAITPPPCRLALRDATWRHAMMTQYHSVACHADGQAFGRIRPFKDDLLAWHAIMCLSGPGSARRMHAGRCPCLASVVVPRLLIVCLRLRRAEVVPSVSL
jgi:hypothetical protein